MKWDKTMIKQDEMRQENWTKIDWDKSDNHIEWLTIIKLDAF